MSGISAQLTLANDPEEMRKLVHYAVTKAVTAFVSEQDDQVELRQAIAQALLRGQPVKDLAAAISTPLADAHVVLMVDGGADLPDAVRTLLPASDNPRTALLAPSGKHLFVLVPIPRPAGAGAVIAAVRDHNAGLLVAASVAPIRSGVPRAVDELQTIMRAVRALDREPAIYQLEDVPIEAALIRSPDLAELLAARLSVLSRSGAPLLETLFSHLDHGQDRACAARELHVASEHAGLPAAADQGAYRSVPMAPEGHPDAWGGGDRIATRRQGESFGGDLRWVGSAQTTATSPNPLRSASTGKC